LQLSANAKDEEEPFSQPGSHTFLPSNYGGTVPRDEPFLLKGSFLGAHRQKVSFELHGVISIRMAFSLSYPLGDWRRRLSHTNPLKKPLIRSRTFNNFFLKFNTLPFSNGDEIFACRFFWLLLLLFFEWHALQNDPRGVFSRPAYTHPNACFISFPCQSFFMTLPVPLFFF